MGVASYLKKLFRSHLRELEKQKTVTWAKEPAIVKIEKPTNLYRARQLGYKAIQGISVVRIRVKKGMRKRPLHRKARKAKSMGIYFPPGKSKQWIAEERVARKYPNMEVLNSYKVGETGKVIYYEVILADRAHPRIMKHKLLSWVSKTRGRVFRGKTSAGRKARGLRGKGFGYEKARKKK